MNAPRSVLIVDPSEETREVLRCALESRGVTTFSAARADAGLKLAATHQPDVIVLDVEVEPLSPGDSHDAAMADRFATHSRGAAGSLVLLGKARRLTRGVAATRGIAGHQVSKPYHYGPLISKIEQLLAVS